MSLTTAISVQELGWNFGQTMDWIYGIYALGAVGFGFGSGWLMRSRYRPDQSTNLPASQGTHLGDSNLSTRLKETQLDYLLTRQMCQFKAGFLSRISHELRSPLNSLIGVHQLILSDLCDNPAEEREFLVQANNSVHKMIQMLDRIIEVSRIEEGRNPLKLEILHLADVFEEVHYLTELQAANRNISLQISQPDPKISIFADQRCLTQVLVTFIDLAINPVGNGRIAICAKVSPLSGSSKSTPSKTSGGDVIISIDLPLPPHCFSEPLDFLQLQKNRKERTPETEVDLSPGTILMMNQSILELMGGHLEIVEAGPVPEELRAVESSEITRLQCSLPQALRES
ncbi:sensor histidine kinase [Laspinema olomoucense]|uniref:histidine kinase n=1 Tax=Laspinema olomoucense D3b TaxID=2953688 RepID=A0ABT2NGF6_9CYAN|nr:MULTISPECIES: HAMP domain-containing sensor histidine kinase [unclassified Laspinema]MCT7972610.1 HAMP domain-containing histidine kinase [Laspinema sp. D3d]MCT7980820.1 HAMP domain-containing histidine kinase [Laspinema sp. D3b]MCT7989286.1 HAMP domain-containing histidine kinase [Laspinema sp. D3a]MCT7992661.1 HAMP domain-containing histidine kinase [Laspinema sp. D3c]